MTPLCSLCAPLSLTAHSVVHFDVRDSFPISFRCSPAWSVPIGGLEPNVNGYAPLTPLILLIMMNMMIGYTLWTDRVGRVGGTQIDALRCPGADQYADARVKLKCKGKLLPSEEGLLLVDDPGSDVQMRRDVDIYNL